MKTIDVFRKNNFLILDKIMNDGYFTIQAKGFINPNKKKFNKPLKKIL